MVTALLASDFHASECSHLYSKTKPEKSVYVLVRGKASAALYARINEKSSKLKT